MEDLEQMLRVGLRRAVAHRPAIEPIDLDAVRRGVLPTPGRPAPRWLAAAAAFALVAGLGVAVWGSGSGGTLPAVPATTPDAAPTAGPLPGTAWRATTIGGVPVVAAPDGDVPSLRFDTATIASGGDPCNGLRSRYVRSADTLRFEGWVATEMACGDEVVVAQQGAYLQALGATAAVRATAEVLEILGEDGTVLASFSRDGGSGGTATPTPTTPPGTEPGAAVTSAVELTRLRWYARELGGEPVPDGGADPVPSLRFLRDGVVEGTDPCNTGSGRYRLDGAGLTIHDWGSDSRDCGTPLQQRFHDALAATSSAGRDGGELLLRDASGVVVARFGPEGEAAQVRVRVHNDTGKELEEVQVTFADGGLVIFGGLAAGGTSKYVDPAGPVYASASAQVRVAGRTLVLLVTDHVGETPLEPGRYTYVLGLDDEGGLTLSLG